jgi:SH2 domain
MADMARLWATAASLSGREEGDGAPGQATLPTDCVVAALIGDDERAAGHLRGDRVLRAFLEPGWTGNVSHFVLEALVGTLVPPETTWSAAWARLIGHPWLAPACSMDGARRFLEMRPKGSFFVRPRSSPAFVARAGAGAGSGSHSGSDSTSDSDSEAESPFSFAFHFVSGIQRVSCVHVRLFRDGGGRVMLKERDEQRSFADIVAAVEHYAAVLQFPNADELQWTPWFYDNFGSHEADVAVAGREPGSFLVRFSSQPGRLVISYVNDGGNFSQSLIQSSDVDGETKFFVYQHEEEGLHESVPALMRGYDAFFSRPVLRSDLFGSNLHMFL